MIDASLLSLVISPSRRVWSIREGILEAGGIVPLTAMDVRNAKADEQDFKLFDSAGLYLLVTSCRWRSWRFKYRYGGKEKLLTFGLYPEVTIAAAREQRDKARAVLCEGKDPAAEDDKLKRALIVAAGTTFKVLGEPRFKDELPGWSTSHAKRVGFRPERDIYPSSESFPFQRSTVAQS